MYNILKQVAIDNSWVFTYARRDHSNLFNEVEQVGVPHIFLDPVVIDNNFGDYNEVESTTYSGTFLLVVSSDIDEVDYDTRYQTYIKPLLETAMGVIKADLVCTNPVTYNTWRTQEIINVFDYNLDGILVNFNITISS